jgi:tetratricopeptide (TPR) repeat protein
MTASGYRAESLAIRPATQASTDSSAAARHDQTKLDDTIAALQKTIQLNPGDVPAHIQLGKALRRQGRLDGSIDEFRQALRIEPGKAEALGELAAALNSRAWTLATNVDPQKRDPARATELAREALEIAPKVADGWNTLGVAQYRAGNWKDAVSSLEKYRQLRTSDAEWTNPFFLAMAHRQLGNQEEARRWYDTGVAWMERIAPTSESLMRARREAADLLGMSEKQQRDPSTAPAPQIRQTQAR